MATSDADKEHSQRLLEIHRKNLRRLEERKAKFGGLEVPNALENEISDLKASIADLEQHQPLPPVIQRARDAVRNQYDNDIDFIIADSAARNRRQTKLEETQTNMAVELHELTKMVLSVAGQVATSEQARKHGASWYRRAVVMALSMAVLALLVASVALIR